MKVFDAARAATVMVALASSAGAATNLVTNGDFAGAPGEINYNTSVTGWTVPGDASSSYTFVYAPGTADNLSTTSVGSYGINPLWGPGDGSNNNLTASSPLGGNFIAQDGDFQNSPIQQTITGLTAGDKYYVTFDYAFSQQYLYTGATTQSWTVSLGAQSQNTASYNLPSEGFSGWQSDTMTFTATSASEVLSFMANGNLPVPPFALLDGVSLSAAPEPADWALLLLGVGAVGAVARTRRRGVSQGAAA
jgi:hypothetical protein